VDLDSTNSLMVGSSPAALCVFTNLQTEVLTHVLSHLPAASLSAMSMVSQRFYSLVTTPHAWRIAFSRFFPGPDAIESGFTRNNRRDSDQEAREQLRSEQRLFTRLTALASWRSEYILRTRLLRSLTRGKPSQIAPGHGASSRSNSAANNANAVVTYNSQLFATINHIHAIWSNGKKSPRFIHGTDETGSACTSDPNIGKIDNWGLTDPHSLPQFTDLFPGDPLYGLGDGLVIGTPNVMDVSQPFGMVYGEGFAGGHAYYRSPEEMRGRFLQVSLSQSEYDLGIPKINPLTESICSIWVAKSSALPTMTEGLVGILTGSSCGVITAYSLGADNLRDNRLAKGEITAVWMLSPGVPIISIIVDESYNVKRKTSGRVWAVVLNALGEVYYLTETPQRPRVERGAKLDDLALARLAWETGRSVYWNFVEPSRRTARDDPWHEAEYDGSYSPRSSCKLMNLSKEQIDGETREIEKFIAFRPAHFRKFCVGWDMRRRMEVDFAGDDGHGAGEGIVIVECGFKEGVETSSAQIKRFSRLKLEQSSFDEYPVPKTPPMASKAPTMASLFGGAQVPVLSDKSEPSSMRSMTPESRVASSTLVEEWRASNLSMDGHDTVEITTSAIDMSTYALLSVVEDPLVTVNGNSAASSPFATPAELASQSLGGVPGHRARFFAVGTNTGSVIIWNMRGPQSTNPATVNELHPLRIIQTDSPQISCIAVSALYIVHGGNDGLVQTWDPLASTLQPIRTLNSRFSSRARRRLVQAEASIQGVGINLYAAGALAIDPDPTVLRGMVSLGTHLRYWSYSSAGSDSVSSKKRRLRRAGERGSNGAPDRFTNTGRGALMDYIATEQEELKKDKERRSREEARLRGRFGVGIAGLSDEEALRYAEMVSAETFEKDEQNRISDRGYLADSSSAQGDWSSQTVTPEGSVVGFSSEQGSARKSSPKFKTDDEFDHDIEEAIRLSLLDGVDDGGRSPRASGSGGYDIPITFKTKKGRRSASSSPSTSQASKNRRGRKEGVASQVPAPDDLEYALQLSLAEEESRSMAASVDSEDFPRLERSVSGKGKGKRRGF
jgi:hypothetical protein